MSDAPCTECGAPDAVQNPAVEIHESLPSDAHCRVCLMEKK